MNGDVMENRRYIYNSEKDVPYFCKWGLGQITGGEHISRLARREASAIGKTLIEEVLPSAKLERRRYKINYNQAIFSGNTCYTGNK